MFEDCRNQWSMSRPLLGLILLNEEVSEMLFILLYTSVSVLSSAAASGLLSDEASVFSSAAASVFLSAAASVFLSAASVF